MSRPKTRYIPSLDGLRAFAVLTVIAYHMNMSWAPGGLLGVTMFFVLSGYLITGLLIAEFDYSGTIDLKDFWMRRIRRIIPAVFFTLIGVAFLCVLFNHALLTKMRPQILPTALFFNNWFQIFGNISYFQALGAPSPITHCWSLSIEEQFYIVWPVFMLLALRAGMRKGTLRKVTTALIVVSAVLMMILFDPTGDPSRVYYGTDTRAFSLLIGALLAMIWPSAKLSDISGRDLSDTERIAFDGAGIAALIGLVLMVGLTNGYSPFIYYGGLVLCSLLTALAIAVMVHPVSVIGKIFSWQPLATIGKLSYSIYLWHYPILLLTTPSNLQNGLPWYLRILQLALIIGMSWLSYTFVENPIRHGAIGNFVRNLREGTFTLREWVQTHLIPVAVCALVVLVTVIGCIFVPDTSALEGGDLLMSEEAQTNAPENNETEPAAPAPDPYDIVMIGDSVSVRAIPDFSQAFPHGLIDAQVNRQLWDAPGILQHYLDMGMVGDVVVFALGTNGVVTDDQIDDVMRVVGSERDVWFVTTRSTTDWQDDSNAALWNAAARYSNVRIIDWFAFSANREDLFDGDGTHLTEEGAGIYTALVKSAVEAYLPEYPEDEAAAEKSTEGDEAAVGEAA